jgi:fluoroacetyl-CoA thioesterase
MKLAPGMVHELRFRVPSSKLVPALYPEAPEFQDMPPVFATGYLVGLIEWACIKAVKPHLTVGTHIDVSHAAPTPAGLEVRVIVRLIQVDGRRLVFEVEAHDGVDLISKGRHERFLIDRARFGERVLGKFK